jgi:hypothetical protein
MPAMQVEVEDIAYHDGFDAEEAQPEYVASIKKGSTKIKTNKVRHTHKI